MSEVNQASDVNHAGDHEKKNPAKERRLNAIYVAQSLSAPGHTARDLISNADAILAYVESGKVPA